MLKKLIKELPSLVPSEDGGSVSMQAPEQRAASQEGNRSLSPLSVDSSLITGEQQHGDSTTEEDSTKPSAVAQDAMDDEEKMHEFENGGDKKVDRLGKSPGEVAFFKLLHAEFNKATHFFDKAQQEFIIREERVREGMNIMKQPNSIMVNEKWSLLAKSLYRLYKDLLLLETFAIMTYCSFSKILKKHDKVTGYQTRSAFMTNVVNNANFTNYPVVLEMISRCEQLYEEVAEHLLKEGKENLYEDERLFINMIHRLNEQVLDTAESEGVPERKERRSAMATNSASNTQRTSPTSTESKATSSLRSLVEENDKKILAAQVSEGMAGVDGDDCGKRKAVSLSSECDKRQKVNDEKTR
jgi:hypothetical protein